jgi:hypothetical protein
LNQPHGPFIRTPEHPPPGHNEYSARPAGILLLATCSPLSNNHVVTKIVHPTSVSHPSSIQINKNYGTRTTDAGNLHLATRKHPAGCYKLFIWLSGHPAGCQEPSTDRQEYSRLYPGIINIINFNKQEYFLHWESCKLNEEFSISW